MIHNKQNKRVKSKIKTFIFAQKNIQAHPEQR